MKVVFCKPCKSVRQQPDGTYVLDGIFHGLTAKAFPCGFPHTELVVEFEMEEDDPPGRTPFNIVFRDTRGNKLWEMEAELNLRGEKTDFGLPERHWATVVVEQGPAIPAPGVYWFDIFQQGRNIGSERISFYQG